ncbi:MAG: polysaccharide biosynthesis protein, partial [Muribaculaceae bacterium]
PIAAPNDVKRYFVSPEESGQICMMASVLGDSGEVFFPKLHKEQMSTFSDMATDLLHQMGYEIVECESDEEAFALAKELKNGSKKYPVLYSASNTTGEKMYEEFYIDGESADLERFNALGVITNLTRRSKEEIDRLFDELNMAFAKANDSKAEVVAIMKRFLVNFDHEEKGKSLDSKM